MANYPNQLIVRLSRFLPLTLPNLGPVQQTGQEMLASAGQALVYAALAAKIIFYSNNYPGAGLIIGRWTAAQHPSPTAAGPISSAKHWRAHFCHGNQEGITSRTGVLCLVIGIMRWLPTCSSPAKCPVLALVAGLMEAVPWWGRCWGPSLRRWLPCQSLLRNCVGGRRHPGDQQVENTLLVPRVMRKAVGVNPFVSLLALFAFSSLLALPGRSWRCPWQPSYSSYSIASSFIRRDGARGLGGTRLCQPAAV